MITLRKGLLLLILPFIAQVIFVSCNCPEPLIEFYSNKKFFLNSLDNRGASVVITTSDSIPKNAFGLRLQVEREKTAFYKPVEAFSFQSAYAFTRRCPPDQIQARDSIFAIKIYSIRAFDANHPAGSEVTDYFKVFQRNTFTPVQEFIKKYKTTLYHDEQLEDKIDFLLMTPPNLNQSHQFKVSISLSDGRLIELLSTEIRFI